MAEGITLAYKIKKHGRVERKRKQTTNKKSTSLLGWREKVVNGHFYS